MWTERKTILSARTPHFPVLPLPAKVDKELFKGAYGAMVGLVTVVDT